MAYLPKAVLLEGGRRLRRLRLCRGWTQAMLADKAGISSRTVWNLEAGLPPRQDTKRLLLRALVIPWEKRWFVWPDAVNENHTEFERFFARYKTQKE